MIAQIEVKISDNKTPRVSGKEPGLKKRRLNVLPVLPFLNNSFPSTPFPPPVVKDPDERPPKLKFADPSVRNDRAAGDLMLRMAAQASRPRSSSQPLPVFEVGEIVEDNDLTHPALQQLIREMEFTVVLYFKSGSNHAYTSVREVVCRCIRAASRIYGEQEAREWAIGFKWDQKKLLKDYEDFKAADFELETMVLRNKLTGLKG
jgi:hypothetical protein